MTREFHASLHGELLAALHYNTLIPIQMDLRIFATVAGGFYRGQSAADEVRQPGIVVVDLPYSPEIGLVVADDDIEFEHYEENKLYTLKVGELYHPAKTRWAECAQFNVRGGAADLTLFFNSPRIDEILAIQKSECEFGLTVHDDVIFFFYRFGQSGIPWSDQPFTIHLVPAHERLVPAVENDRQGLLLQVFLVDAQTVMNVN